VAQIGWQELCDLVKDDDGLPVRDVGVWSEDKLYFWHRYVQITTTAMVGKSTWSSINYIDLFSGPGVCRVEVTGKRLPGSPLIAAYATKPFSKIIACELDPVLASACRKRLDNSPAKEQVVVFEGDCNLHVNEIVQLIPKRSLTLAFIDPEALHVQFNTVKQIASCGAVDLLILVADAFDISRNVDKYYFNNQQSKLDYFLGHDSNWRNDWGKLDNRTSENVHNLFYEVYKRQLNSIGYTSFGEQRISGPSGPLYRLVYASKNDRGLDFWNKAKKRDRKGQDSLFN